MFKFKNLLNNDNVKIVEKKDNIRVLEYINDLSVTPYSAVTSYFSSKMNVRKRQLLIEINNNEYTVSAGAMQWTVGNVEVSSDVKGIGDFLGKTIKGAVTKESGVKPKYKGNGLLMLEPTYRHILLEDISDWEGGIVLDDGLFLACESKVKQDIVMRSNISSALFGKEGLFNLKLSGNGIVFSLISFFLPYGAEFPYIIILLIKINCLLPPASFAFWAVSIASFVFTV